MTIVTRSGTNEFHGSVSEYIRHDALDAPNWFVNRAGLPKPRFRFSDYGGTAGGPIQRDHTFFFAAYEGLRVVRPNLLTNETPTLAARAAATSLMKPLLDAYPVPNGRELGNGFAEYTATFSSPLHLDTVGVRIDHRLSTAITLFGRYNRSRSSNGLRGANSSSQSVVATSKEALDTMTAGATSLFGRKLVQDVRVNISRNRVARISTPDTFGGAAFFPDSLIPAIAAGAESSFLQFVLQNGHPGSIAQRGILGGSIQRQFNLVSTTTYDAGPHQLKAGVDFRQLDPTTDAPAYSLTVTFPNVAAASAGSPATVSIVANTPGAPRFRNFSAYGQDTWRLASATTVTFGVRWEVNPAPRSREGTQPILAGTLSDLRNIPLLPAGTVLWPTTYNNVAPRAGITHKVGNSIARELIVRGGVGLFYDLGYGSAGRAFGGGFPFSTRKVLTGYRLPILETDATPAVAVVPGASTVFSFPEPLKLPRTTEWNVSIEKPLPGPHSIMATYVGAAGRRLLRQESYTIAASINPTMQSVASISNSAWSNYKALQLQYQRRLSHGIQGLASYTLGHAVDTVSDEFNNVQPAARFDQSVDEGDADFDVRHAFRGALTLQTPATTN